jgi:hypothetical protein
MQCLGYNGDHRYRYFHHRKEKVRVFHHVQQAKIVEDMGRRVPRIYVTLDNKQVKFQSHMIEFEGMI